MKILLSLILPLLVLPVLTSCQGRPAKSPITVEARQPRLPVLSGKARNKVLVSKVEVPAAAGPVTVTALDISLEGTTRLADIKRVEVLYSPTDEFADARVFGSRSDVRDDLTVLGEQSLDAGTNYFWLSVELKGTPELSHRIAATLNELHFTDGSKVPVATDPASRPQRIGVALRQHGDDGVDTYRIPGLATTNEGTLIAVYDVRYDDPVDLQENIDVGLSRSTDGGQSWEQMKIIMDMGTYGGLPEDQNGIGDPAVLVDRNTNTIWVASLWFHGHPGERAWNASAPGLAPAETGQLMLVKSEDDGLTWSDPINVTPQLKHPDWQLFFNGPGSGITLEDGTLVFAAQYKDADRVPHSTIIYSKDGGKNWSVGTGAKSETTEAQVVELSDGSLMLNMRDDRNRANRQDSLNGRSVAITRDLGATWTEHPTSRSALPASNCMASIIGVDHPERGKLLFFSNPNTKVNRDHITVKTSLDDGMTWPTAHQLELYEENTYGYSCLTRIDEHHIGILYEGSKELYFEKIHLDELLNEE